MVTCSEHKGTLNAEREEAFTVFHFLCRGARIDNVGPWATSNRSAMGRPTSHEQAGKFTFCFHWTEGATSDKARITVIIQQNNRFTGS